MPKYNSYTINKCQISGSKNLKSILNLGYLPPVNLARPINKKIKEELFFPTEMLYCPVSKLYQLSYIVDKKILFPKSYPYTSSTTKILRENFSQLSKECMKKNIIKKNDLIIDIGSNDGNLLSYFKNFCKVQGITPENIGKQAIKKGIPTILGYFDDKNAKYISKKIGRAKIITATNVFAHIDNTNSLMKNIKKCLLADGVFIIEIHYFLDLIKTIQYDTIYHEHMRYYTLESLEYILNRHGFKIFDAKRIKTHGGSLRVYASVSKKYKILPSINKIKILEKKYLNKKKIEIFKKKVLNSKYALIELIKKIKNQNKKIFAIGAPSRASTLINFIGIDHNMIDYVLEVNGSSKINNFMPGTNIPIVSEDLIKKNKPDYLLILSWHIYPAIIATFRNMGFKGRFIIPLPKPRIV